MILVYCPALYNSVDELDLEYKKMEENYRRSLKKEKRTMSAMVEYLIEQYKLLKREKSLFISR